MRNGNQHPAVLARRVDRPLSGARQPEVSVEPLRINDLASADEAAVYRKKRGGSYPHGRAGHGYARSELSPDGQTAEKLLLRRTSGCACVRAPRTQQVNGSRWNLADEFFHWSLDKNAPSPLRKPACAPSLITA